MSHPAWDAGPAQREIDLLATVAATIVDVFEARGFKVDQALEVDTAFGNRVRSAALRDLAVDAASQAASQGGVIDFRTVAGGGREFRFFDGRVDRRYRFRIAGVDSQGNHIITASSDSALTSTDSASDGDDELFRVPIDRWVFGVTFTPDNGVSGVFIARIVGFEEGTPGRLILGHEIDLVPRTPVLPPHGFESTDEDLDLGDDVIDDEGKDEQGTA